MSNEAIKQLCADLSTQACRLGREAGGFCQYVAFEPEGGFFARLRHGVVRVGWNVNTIEGISLEVSWSRGRHYGSISRLDLIKLCTYDGTPRDLDEVAEALVSSAACQQYADQIVTFAQNHAERMTNRQIDWYQNDLKRREQDKQRGEQALLSALHA